MKAVRDRRGSVLLMAIGLLTVIAILASTFMIVSNLDAQEQLTLSTKDMADPVAYSAVSTVVAYAHRDLYIAEDDDYGPFSNLENSTGVDAWKKYIDTPGGAQVDANGNVSSASERVDLWLAAPYDASAETQGGRPFPVRAVYTKIHDDADTSNDPNRLDTDGDDIKDALAYHPFGRSDNEEANPESKYRVGVRVIDHGGLICVNTAGERMNITDPASPPAGMPSSRSPVLVDLKGFLGDAYTQLHNKRCAGQTDRDPQDQPASGGKLTLREFDRLCGRRLLDPSGFYRPFDIGDELFLRWCETLRDEAGAKVGRLAEVIGEEIARLNDRDNTYTDLPRDGDEIKRKLTTFSCVSARLRHPGHDERIGRDFRFLAYLDPLNDPDEVYRQALRMIRELRLGSGDDAAERLAAHFTANLKAYLTPLADAKKDWPSYNAGGYTAYGVKQDVIISEVFAKHFVKLQDNSKPEDQTWAWGCAVELMNPSSEDASINEFELWVGDQKIGALGDINIPAAKAGNSFQKVVLYNFRQGKDEDGNTPLSGPEELFGRDVKDWHKVPELDLRGEGDRKLTLRRTQGGFVVDECRLGADGLDYNFKVDPNNPGGDTSTKDRPVVRDLRRDDRWAISGTGNTNSPRARYNLGIWKAFGAPALGEGNTGQNAGDDWLTSGAKPAGKGGKYSAPIYEGRQDPDINNASRLVFDSIGDLCDIYFCGPSSDLDRGGFPQQVINTDDTAICQEGPSRGRLDPLSTQLNIDGFSPGRYPDVPPGALLAEFFTNVRPHTTRQGDTTGAAFGHRIYGLINVNTATRRVLEQLPWPEGLLYDRDLQRYEIRLDRADIADIVNSLLRYRNDPDRFRARLPGDVRGAFPPGLRNRSDNIPAFLTPGEVGTALAAICDRILLDNRVESDFDTLQMRADYVHARNALYRAVADCISTRSDVFTVYVKVAYGASQRFKWRYIATFDRSNVSRRYQSPVMLMFTPVHTWNDVSDN